MAYNPSIDGDEETFSFSDFDIGIPPVVVEAYTAAYPHLRHLAAGLADITDRRAIQAFARAALQLAAPPTVAMQHVIAMAKSADAF